MRAREPDETGVVDRDGVPIAWERFGRGTHTVVLLPTWQIIHARGWKMQVPHLARRLRVVTHDPRGNGRSGRPPTGYGLEERVADSLAVIGATCGSAAALVAFSQGANIAATIAARRPELVERLVLIGPAIGTQSAGLSFWDDEPDPADRFTAASWRRDYEGFATWFFEQVFSEPHSTKQTDDCVGWALETTPEVLIAGEREFDRSGVPALLPRIACPTLVIHGADDRIIPPSAGERVAEAIPDARLVLVDGGGHAPHVRDPVRVNGLLDVFLDPVPPRCRRLARALHRHAPRALYVSSPIGLGHAQRDLAIARELRALRPDLEISWLAQHPVTRVLEAAGETIHPASAQLANESAHIESQMGEHRLHCFQALREMDEILLANFMVFLDLVREERFDLWIGDEAWELDYHLHENPELKSAPYAFLTDFVGYLPMDVPGSREAAVAADYNHENIRHVERYPYVRDAAVFIGSPEDIVPREFGPGLPFMHEWIPRHFDFSVLLADHFEQSHHVAHRLRRYGAPAPTPYDEATPARLAELICERLAAPVSYLPVETCGAARAAALLAPLLAERKGLSITHRGG